MKPFTFTAATALVAVAPTVAQTPPGFSPSTNETLEVKVGNMAVAPGKAVALSETTLSPGTDFSSVPGSSAHIVVMLDLDAPVAVGEINRTFSLLHWMASIPEDLKTLPGNDSTTKPTAMWFNPQPATLYQGH